MLTKTLTWGGILYNKLIKLKIERKLKKHMKKQNIIMGISFVLLFVMVIGVSYAAYKFSAAGTKENVISTGTISMSYSQNSFIDLKHTYPKTDTYAIATKEDKSSMEFSVSMETS